MRLSILAFACCLMGLLGGCTSDRGTPSQGEVEAKLKEALGVETVALTARPEGGYSGTGRKADGTTYTITVDARGADGTLWYTATSDTGELKAGGFREVGPAWLRPLQQASNWGKVALVLLVVIGSGFVVARKLARRFKHPEPDPPPDPGGPA